MQVVEKDGDEDSVKYLIATSEQPLACFHANEAIERSKFPMRSCVWWVIVAGMLVFQLASGRKLASMARTQVRVCQCILNLNRWHFQDPSI